MKWDKTITTEQEYEKALARLAIIFKADPDSAEGMEAELLVTLIEKYEKELYPVSLPDPIDAIRETMERKAWKDKDLIPAIGSKTTVSLVLNRKVALTIDMIRKLSELLGLPVEVLIQPYELGGRQETANRWNRYLCIFRFKAWAHWLSGSAFTLLYLKMPMIQFFEKLELEESE